MTARLFTPITLGGVSYPNRIVVAPMCQYTADDGVPGDWHLGHYGTLAQSGAGLVVFEASGVERAGRISHGCLGIYSAACEAGLARIVAHCRRFGQAMLGIQIGHAGRKASSQRPREGGSFLREHEDPWQTVAPSAIPFAPDWPVPRELTEPDLDRLADHFAEAARRADRAGFDEVELHAAHGYLLHSFLSPVSNRRTDRYGGSLENRMRFPLRVADAVRAAWPEAKTLGARITGSDWMDGGITPDEAVAFARALGERGLDFVCVSSGGVQMQGPRVVLGPGYQVPFAARVRREAGVATRAVGLIATPMQAEAVLDAGDADQIALARAMLDDPRWGLHAADAFGVDVPRSPQYARAAPKLWPGAAYAAAEGQTRSA